MITRMRTLLRKIARSRSGLAMTEFALAAPLLMTAGLWGTEVAWLALTNLRISQTAMQLADNGSRIGETSNLQEVKVYESDINEILLGANIQAGDSVNLFERGRVVVSSLQVDPDSPGGSNKQFIAWQRCLGKKQADSKYGGEGYGKNDPLFIGMGPPGHRVSAVDESDAVIVVEIFYDYQPLFSSIFIGNTTTIRAESSFSIRATRDLTQVYDLDKNGNTPTADCKKYQRSVA